MTRLLPAILALTALATTAPAASAQGADKVRPRIDQRFAASDVKETPDFRQHIVPLLGRLGCNGRACHGSFQGQGGFRLSLFGYDFKSDHENLLAGDEPRTNLKEPEESLILKKPTEQIPHEGGERMKVGSWQFRVLHKWVRSGAPSVDDKTPEFVRLDLTPSEIVGKQKGQKIQLRAVAVWSDGTREDVTPLCRFQTNNEQVAEIDENGLVTVTGPGDSHVVAFYDNGVVPVPVMLPVSDKVGPKYPKLDAPTKIDELVMQKLRKVGIVPSDVADDAEFLRRVSLDITGTLPTPSEVEQFLADSSPDKRARKIDELLESPAYSAWWATRLSDITGNNQGFLNNIGFGRGTAPQEWYDWIRVRIEKNVPYDKLVEGVVLAKSRQEGESFEDYCKAMSDLYRKDAKGSFADRDSLTYFWARQNFKKPDERAIGFAYTFLGMRIQCAQCHKHPFDQWTKHDFEQFTKFFDRVNYATADNKLYQKMVEELKITKKGNQGQIQKELEAALKDGKVVPFKELYVNSPKGKGKTEAKLLGGAVVEVSSMDDPREALMEWMRAKDNPYFARALVNRVWAAYFNVGIVEPPDNLSLANPPSNGPLLDYLAKSFIEHGFDMKWLHREIANSQAYQRSWQPNETNRLDLTNFSHAIPRRLAAEVAYDAVQQATASDDEIKELRTSVKGRAIANPIVDSRRNNGSYALTIFGRSTRESNCDCDRSMEPSLLQTVYLQNDQELLNLLDRRGGWAEAVANPKAKTGEARNRQDELQRIEKQMADLRERIQSSKKASNPKAAEKFKSFEKRFADLRRQREELRRREEKTARKLVPSEMSAEDLNEIVREAYLRSLSRLPDEGELSRARQYIASAGDLKTGARDVLWALINTKEFIVNH